MAGKYWAIVPAAGKGSRFGDPLPKQYHPLSGKTVIEQTIAKLNDFGEFQKIAVAIAPDDQHWKSLEIDTKTPVQTYVGGEERLHSVYNAAIEIEKEMDEDDWILVHDAARPCVDLDDIRRLIVAVSGHPCGGILAAPISDTLKRVDATQQVSETMRRDVYWRAFTPQLFLGKLLIDALEQRIHDYPNKVFDEAGAMELAGHRPLVVEGQASNIKITSASDLELAQSILEAQS